MIVEPKNTKNKKPLKNNTEYNNIDNIDSKQKRICIHTYTKSNNINNNILNNGPRLVLPLRVKPIVYVKYHKLSREEKREIRDMFEQLVIGYIENLEKKEKIININIAIAKSESKAKAEISIDPDILLRENRMLKEEKRKLKEIVSFYEKELRKRDEDIKELQEKLREAEKQKRELEKAKEVFAENQKLKKRIEELRRTIRYALSYLDEKPQLAKKILEQEVV